MEPYVSNELSHKRVSELRHKHIADTDQLEEYLPLKKGVVRMEGNLDIGNEIVGRSNEGTPHSTLNYVEEANNLKDISSTGLISKIPILPTVSVYILVIIIIGTTLAFNGTNHQYIQDLNISTNGKKPLNC